LAEVGDNVQLASCNITAFAKHSSGPLNPVPSSYRRIFLVFVLPLLMVRQILRTRPRLISSPSQSTLFITLALKNIFQTLTIDFKVSLSLGALKIRVDSVKL
jgi:hypothetical protein